MGDVMTLNDILFFAEEENRPNLMAAVMAEPDFDKDQALIWAAREGHTGIVHLLIEKGAALDVRGSNGRAALNWAIRKGRTKIAARLREAGAVFSIA